MDTSMELKNCQWITTSRDLGDTCPVFRKGFRVEQDILSAKLEITALGVYEAQLNGRRVGDFVLALLRHERCHHDLGALGRCKGRRQLLEYGYEFLQPLCLWCSG